MAVASISKERQLILPLEIFNELGLAPGDEVKFEPFTRGVYLVSAASERFANSDDAANAKSIARHRRLAALKAEIQATPAALMESYQRETASWEAAELADAAETA